LEITLSHHQPNGDQQTSYGRLPEQKAARTRQIVHEQIREILERLDETR
jgi:hypothetical protein